MVYKKSRFRPRRAVRSFRDLEVYQKALEGAVMVAKRVIPLLKEVDYPLEKEMLKCSLELPQAIAQAHSVRFDDKEKGLSLLDDSMAKCNAMVVYLEQVRDIYSQKEDRYLLEELIRKYISNRRKIFHLYKSWKKFLAKDGKE